MAKLPTSKREWREKREKYGIPSGLTKKVDMGSEFEKFQKAADKHGVTKPAKILKAAESLKKKMDIYFERIEAAADDKFTKDKDAAVEYYEKLLEQVNIGIHLNERTIRPIKFLTEEIPKCRNEFSTFDANSDSNAVGTFYTSKFRQLDLSLKALAEIEDDFEGEYEMPQETNFEELRAGFLEFAEAAHEESEGGDSLEQLLMYINGGLELLEEKFVD